MKPNGRDDSHDQRESRNAVMTEDDDALATPGSIPLGAKADPIATTTGRATARAIMIQGCGSDVGKSILVAGLCRAAVRRGHCVAPFKAQNMSNNAAVVTAAAVDDKSGTSGGEIGRAQALQAWAAKTPATVDMNPVLLKPQSDMTCQVVVQGRVAMDMSAKEYFGSKSPRPRLLDPIVESFHRLSQQYDLIVCEGAGSPAEINLRSRDVANMGFCVEVGIPVVIVGDIDRGGVIASLVGTKVVLDAVDAAHVVGCIVNKFRGDLSLFDDGVVAIERLTGWPCLGVVPWLPCASKLPAEDAVVLERNETRSGSAEQDDAKQRIRIAAPMLSRMANFDDVDPLRIVETERVDFRWIPPGSPIPIKDVDVILLLGTKSVLADLDFVRANGWDVDISSHVRQGGCVLGLCGGYQMLGQSISDPHGVDGVVGTRKGLGLLQVDTVLKGGSGGIGNEPKHSKTVRQVTGSCAQSKCSVEGYEIHMGETSGVDAMERPMVINVAVSSTPSTIDHSTSNIHDVTDGARSPCGRIEGCYVHGLFVDDDFRRGWLDRVSGDDTGNGSRGSGIGGGGGYNTTVEAALDELADGLEASLDLDALFALAQPAGWKPVVDAAPS